MKRLTSLLLAIVMVFSFAATSLAVNNSITINKAKPGESYSIYKLFDLSVDNAEDPAAYSYTINENWAAFFGDGGAGKQYITLTNGYVTAISDAAMLADAASKWAGKPDALATLVCGDEAESVTFENLENGYYLITSTLGTLAMTETTPSKEAVTITEKNPTDTIIKLVQEDSLKGESGNEGWQETNDAQIGDTVYFKSTITLNPNTRNVVVHDKMDAGLTFVSGSAVIQNLAAENYTVNESPSDGDTFDIVFADTYLKGITEVTALTLTYQAVLNENAIVTAEDDAISIADQKNVTKINYGDAQSAEDSTITKTYKFAIHKHAANDAENYLAGATFQLKKADAVVKLIRLDDNNYRIAKSEENGAVESFTTNSEGAVVIWGVDNDEDYTLTETAAPAGYNLLASPVSITVNTDNSLVINIPNQSGTELPSTGGMGTTIFYIVGSILVIGSAVLLVTKKRMSRDD